MSHKEVQRNPRHVRRPEDCLAFFCVRSFLLLDLCGSGLGFSGGRGRFRTVLGTVTYSTTEHAEVVIETPLSFRSSKLAVFTEFVGESGRAGRGRGLVVGLLLVFLVLEVRVVLGSGAFLVV